MNFCPWIQVCKRWSLPMFPLIQPNLTCETHSTSWIGDSILVIQGCPFLLTAQPEFRKLIWCLGKEEGPQISRLFLLPLATSLSKPWWSVKSGSSLPLCHSGEWHYLLRPMNQVHYLCRHGPSLPKLLSPWEHWEEVLPSLCSQDPNTSALPSSCISNAFSFPFPSRTSILSLPWAFSKVQKCLWL